MDLFYSAIYQKHRKIVIDKLATTRVLMPDYIIPQPSSPVSLSIYPKIVYIHLDALHRI